MINKLFYFLKKIIFNIILIYSINLIMVPMNVKIPLNFISIILVSFFGFPAIIGIYLFMLI